MRWKRTLMIHARRPSPRPECECNGGRWVIFLWDFSRFYLLFVSIVRIIGNIQNDLLREEIWCLVFLQFVVVRGWKCKWNSLLCSARIFTDSFYVAPSLFGDVYDNFYRRFWKCFMDSVVHTEGKFYYTP